MAGVTNAISSLPGSRHTCPPGMPCDRCGSPATVRIQGNTDSFGSEMLDFCKTCLNKIQAEAALLEDRAVRCDWCDALVKGCMPCRDADEGACGPVYLVCPECIHSSNEELDEEAESSYSD